MHEHKINRKVVKGVLFYLEINKDDKGVFFAGTLLRDSTLSFPRSFCHDLRNLRSLCVQGKEQKKRRKRNCKLVLPHYPPLPPRAGSEVVRMNRPAPFPDRMSKNPQRPGCQGIYDHLTPENTSCDNGFSNPSLICTINSQCTSSHAKFFAGWRRGPLTNLIRALLLLSYIL